VFSVQYSVFRRQTSPIMPELGQHSNTKPLK